MLSRLLRAWQVELYGVINDQTHVYLIMEYCRGGDLFKQLMLKGGCLEEAWVSSQAPPPLSPHPWPSALISGCEMCNVVVQTFGLKFYGLCSRRGQRPGGGPGQLASCHNPCPKLSTEQRDTCTTPAQDIFVCHACYATQTAWTGSSSNVLRVHLLQRTFRSSCRRGIMCLFGTLPKSSFGG